MSRPGIIRPQQDIEVPRQKDIKKRTSELLMNIGIAHDDTNGLMRHILDCLGALRVRIRDDQQTTVAERRVFRDAAVSLCERVGAEFPIDDGTAIDFLYEAFPDASKKTDGRSWLPLHWASALDISEEDYRNISRPRPVVASKDHMHGNQLVVAQVQDYGKGLGLDGRGTSPSNGNGTKTNSYLDLEDHVDGLLPLHFMVSNTGCKLSSLKVLLRCFPDAIKTTDRRGWLPLHWAAYNCCSEEVVDYLIEHFPQGAFCATIKGQLPFTLTTHNHNFGVVMRIFDANPDGIHAIDNAGNNALHDACTFWNTEAVQRLFSLASELNGERNFRGQYPIHRIFSLIYPHESAKIYKQLQTLQTLLTQDLGCSAYVDKNGCLPLHLAIKFDSSYVIIEYLYHAYPSAALCVDKNNHTPLDYLKHLYAPSLEKESGYGGSHDWDGSGAVTAASPNKTTSITAIGSAVRAARKLSPMKELGTNNALYANPYATTTNDATTAMVAYGSSNGSTGGVEYINSDDDGDETTYDYDHTSKAHSIFDSKLTNRHVDKDLFPSTPLDDKTRHDKFVKIQTLLLSAHPSIARAGGTSSFTKFSVHTNVHKG